MKTSLLPLLVHADAGAPFAWRDGALVTAGQFLAQARELAPQLAAADQVLNLCADRYVFAVGFAAALIAGKPSLLPSAHATTAIRPPTSGDVLCLADDARLDAPFRKLHFTAPPVRYLAEGAWQVPQLDASRTAAYVFTSGSTGAPVPHAKSWGSLARDAAAQAVQLGLRDGTRPLIVGTVPAQHMYGLESTVLLPMLSGALLCNERPFFPADVVARLAALPAPRVLVTTPVHLRALLGAGLEVPKLRLLVVSTAPLQQSLAQLAEARLGCPLLEIYGSTECGQIAVRRTGSETAWRLCSDVSLRIHEGLASVSGGHVEHSVALADSIEMLDAHSFLMHGRHSDQVNIAGKRSSLAYLNHQLAAIPGVVDGVFFHRHGSESGASADVGRLAAAVVAPGCDASVIVAELRQRIDAAFMPRPLLLVERLPRDASGKVPREQLQQLRFAHGLQ